MLVRLLKIEEIEIRLYSIIYDAINEIKDAMEGLLEPTEKEIITGNIEVREIFKISKVGTVAGCLRNRWFCEEEQSDSTDQRWYSNLYWATLDN